MDPAKFVDPTGYEKYMGPHHLKLYRILLSGGEQPGGKMAAGPYNYSYIFKYIIIGDMGVGKSCLLHQFTEKKCKIFIFTNCGQVFLRTQLSF